MKKDKKKVGKPEVYEGYYIEWLRKEPQHPDYKLVAEYDKKYGHKEKQL